MAIPFYDHAVANRALEPALDAAVARVLESGRLDWGPEVPAFEAAFARWLGAGHAVGTNSGTAALKVALLGLGIGRGDEVITVPNSDIGSTAAIHHAGATAVWVDVEPDTGERRSAPCRCGGHPADGRDSCRRSLRAPRRHGRPSGDRGSARDRDCRGRLPRARRIHRWPGGRDLGGR